MMNEKLHEAIVRGYVDGVVACLKSGADPNSVDQFDDSALRVAIHKTQDLAQRHKLVEILLSHGADPKILSPHGDGPLFAAVIEYDSKILELLLERGADPNREHDDGEPLFDWAEFHYRNDEYDLDLPVEPTDRDKASTDSWLEFLERIASNESRSRLACLHLLRKYGALGWRERE